MTEIPGTAAIERLAHDAIRKLPKEFRDYLADVVIRVEEFADEETLHSVGLTNPWSLIGLYHGHPLGKQSIWSSGDMPSTITLFRRPLINEWRETGAALEDVVNHVVVHEVGHHFGLSDQQIYTIEDEPD
ncbi:neutral zinc metallopeptidase [Croceicoccus estronivorus]|uniref:metallopeptidase family protein n=1 Tax=Croceicoccus estronivorus TaxID=1172626 RepID=UPI000835B966|nr:metallopeptidase family protein [Croceicoccus estronivorus]OCC23340.1 neutral zinc metallopeptidase [Croceicoccus estronivorus]